MSNITQDRMRKRIFDWSAPEALTGCWFWLGSCGNSGYGKTRFTHSKDMTAHRVSYMGFKGEIPEGMNVLHVCDVRTCVNPEHLFLGTQRENIKDMVTKGRHKCPARERTQCPQGHEYSGVNSNGARICKICMKDARQRFERKYREQPNSI